MKRALKQYKEEKESSAREDIKRRKQVLTEEFTETMKKLNQEEDSIDVVSSLYKDFHDHKWLVFPEERLPEFLFDDDDDPHKEIEIMSGNILVEITATFGGYKYREIEETNANEVAEEIKLGEHKVVTDQTGESLVGVMNHADWEDEVTSAAERTNFVATGGWDLSDGETPYGTKDVEIYVEVVRLRPKDD